MLGILTLVTRLFIGSAVFSAVFAFTVQLAEFGVDLMITLFGALRDSHGVYQQAGDLAFWVMAVARIDFLFFMLAMLWSLKMIMLFTRFAFS